jgi:hypothetical protein
VNEDHGHAALPKLMGAPAYARPRRDFVPASARPFDPDDLPIEAYRAQGEQEPANGMEPGTEGVSTATGSSEPADFDGSWSQGSGRWLRFRIPGRSRDSTTD